MQDETAELPSSEGEFQYKPSVAPENDPVLMLLSRFQSHKGSDADVPTNEQYGLPGHYGVPGAGHYGISARGQHHAGQFDMNSHQVQDLLNYTGKSMGRQSVFFMFIFNISSSVCWFSICHNFNFFVCLFSRTVRQNLTKLNRNHS